LRQRLERRRDTAWNRAGRRDFSGRSPHQRCRVDGLDPFPRSRVGRMTLSSLAARTQGRYQRSAARFLFRRPFPIDTQVPLISFTFDDFPRSALLTGGAILKRFGLLGTYYASFGLMGTKAPTGSIFLADDIGAL